MQDAEEWVLKEIKTADFGDKRLNKRYGKLLHNLMNAPNSSIPQAFKTWGETLAAYRFFNHDNITSTKILSPHRNETLQRIEREKIVLILQDTTEIDFTGRNSIAGMGYLGSHDSQGFYLHPSLAVTPEKLSLGVVGFQTWTREKLGIRLERKNKLFEEKESFRWLKGYEIANTIALNAPDTVIVSIADREGDIYEVLEKTQSRENKAYWLIRSSMDRGLLNEAGEKQQTRLREQVSACEPIGKIEFKLPSGTIYKRGMKEKRQARKERIVQQEIRIFTAHLRPPQRKGKKLSPHCD